MSSGNNEAKADAIAPIKLEAPAKSGGWALLTRTRKLAFVVVGSVLGVTSAVVGTKYFTASPGSARAESPAVAEAKKDEPDKLPALGTEPPPVLAPKKASTPDPEELPDIPTPTPVIVPPVPGPQKPKKAEPELLDLKPPVPGGKADAEYDIPPVRFAPPVPAKTKLATADENGKVTALPPQEEVPTTTKKRTEIGATDKKLIIIPAGGFTDADVKSPAKKEEKKETSDVSDLVIPPPPPLDLPPVPQDKLDTKDLIVAPPTPGKDKAGQTDPTKLEFEPPPLVSLPSVGSAKDKEKPMLVIPRKAPEKLETKGPPPMKLLGQDELPAFKAPGTLDPTSETLPPRIKPPQIDVGPTPRAAAIPSPETLAPKNYEEDWHTPKSGDTYAMISQEYYKTADYGPALEAYNKGRLKPGDSIVRVPPLWVLDEKHPALSTSKPERASAVEAKPTGLKFDPVDSSPPAARPAPLAVAPAADEYVVKATDGETIREVARKVFGDPNAWKRLYSINPDIDPTQPIPAGTTLRLPR